MNCWHCVNQELIWNDDHMMEDDMGAERLVSFFSCPSCNALVEFYYGDNNEDAKA